MSKRVLVFGYVAAFAVAVLIVVFSSFSRTVTPEYLKLPPLDQAVVDAAFSGFQHIRSDSVPSGRLLQKQDVAIDGLLPRDVYLWLPEAYNPSSSPLPVIYMHDAQNLFEAGKSYTGDEWGVDEALTRLIDAGTIPPVMVVALSNTSERWQDYAPADVFANLPADLRDRMQSAQGGEPKSDAYLRLIIEDVKPMIDEQFNTAPGHKTTFIAGSSMGGLISLYAAGEYPEVFGGAAALSIHWPLSDPRDPDALEAIPAMQAWLNESKLKPAQQVLYFDRGSLNLDATYPPYADAMEAFFAEKGWEAEFRVHEGTDHNEAAWAARLDEVFSYMLADLPVKNE